MTEKLLPSSDVDLWQQVVAGSTEAFEEVVQRYKGTVSAVAYSILGDFNLSQDVAQETFWAAWRGREQLLESKRLASWLSGIARNLAKQSLRKSSRECQTVDWDFEQVSSTELDPVLSSISTEESHLVWHAIEALPELYREPLVIYYRQGESITDVAASLDISIDAAKQRLSRGREMLRAQVVQLVENVLKRSRPGHQFTSRVLAGVAAFTVSTNNAATAAAAALTATATTVSKAATSGLTAASAKAASGWLGVGSITGFLGGLTGAMAGIGGAWLGTWIPAQMAPTMAQRRLLEKHSKRVLALGVIMTVVLIILQLFLRGLEQAYAIVLIGVLVAFGILICLLILTMHFELKRLRATENANAEPNLSQLRRRFGCWKGTRYTSSARLFGIPLVDIQLQDVGTVAGPHDSSLEITAAQSDSLGPGKFPKSNRRHAFGWLAIGDRATGLILAFGGVARGLIAFGGLAMGGIAFGGCALGLLSVGGVALGIIALGGGAIGLDSGGGAAVGWNSAAGGLAIARGSALGGGAYAQHVIPNEMILTAVQTGQVQPEISQVRLAWMLFAALRHKAVFLIAAISLSLAPSLLMLLFYRRQ